MIRKLYDWTLSLAEHPHAYWALGVVAFVESSFFPIPPDILMIPMILAAPHRAFWIAGIATLASVAGGFFGYFIGWGLFESLGQPILDFYGKTHDFDTFAARFNEHGPWIVLMAGITPFPYKVITIASGTTGLNLFIFGVSSLLARALRFFVVAGLLWKFGPPIREFVDRRLGLVFTLFFILLLGGFALTRYL